MDTGDLGGSLGEPHLANSPTNPAKLSPTLTRSYDHNDLEHLERQRTMDADFAMQLCESEVGWIAQWTHCLDLYFYALNGHSTS